MQTMYFSLPSLPWDKSSEDERNFRIIIGVALVLFVVMSVAIHMIDLPPKQREQIEAVPPRIAKLVTNIRLPPPPPPPPAVEEPKPEVKPELKPEPKPEAPKKEEPKPVEPPKPVEKPKPVPTPKPAPVVKKAPVVQVQTAQQQQQIRKEQARQEATKAAAAFDSLADLRDVAPVETVASLSSAPQVSIPSGAAGSGGAIGAANDDAPAPTSRNLIGKMAAGGSGGVQVARASSGGGGAGTAGGTGKLRATSATQVSSAITTQVAAPALAEKTKTSPSAKSRRTMEQIQMVFDRYKGQINALYQRALREDPALEGTLMLKLEIAADGRVTACSVASSELGNPDLERKIMIKVKQLNFGSANVETWSGTFPIKFFPS